MFSLTVTDLEINDVLSELTGIEYPNSIKLQELTRIIFGTSTDIQQRKVRLCIAELRKRGHLIIAKRGYSLAGDDPEQVIHFINGLYSRANKLTKEADIMFHEFKQKYGDELSKKICQFPEQPMIGFTDYRLEKVGEPAFHKAYNAKGEQIEP
jgi:hypothetical protein